MNKKLINRIKKLEEKKEQLLTQTSEIDVELKKLYELKKGNKEDENLQKKRMCFEEKLDNILVKAKKPDEKSMQRNLCEDGENVNDIQ